MNRQVLVPLITPIDHHGNVCGESVKRLVRCLRHSVDAFIACLTSGEGWIVSDRQWRDMLASVLEHAGDRPVIAGIERATTQEVLALARYAVDSGATGIMLTSPYGTDVRQAEILTHYRKIHDSVDVDVYIYNESTLSGNETSFDTLLSISSLPRVVGIKDSAEEQRSPDQIRALQANGLKYYFGWEHHIGTGSPGDGCVVSLANLEPALCRVALSGTGDSIESECMRAEVARLTGIHSLLDEKWYAHIKQELFNRGVIATPRVIECESADAVAEPA